MNNTPFTYKTVFPALMVVSMLVGNAQAESRCVTDDTERLVCVKAAPLRIISLSPGSTELLFAAGAGSQVIATDQHSDYPPEAINLPKVGGFQSFSIEKIVAMNPDLVVVWGGGNSPDLIRKIEDLNLKTFNVDARDFAGIESDIRKLGQIAGTEQQATQSADQFSERLTRLKKQYSEQKTVSVFFEIWRQPLITMGDDQVISDAIKVCGGLSIFSEVSGNVVTVGMEQLISKAPEVILSSDPRGDTAETREAMLGYWKQWSTLTAVKKRQMFAVPSDLIARPTPRILDGTEIICNQLQSVRSQSAHKETQFITAK